MVIGTLYMNVILVLFIMAMALIFFVIFLIFFDYVKRRTVNEMSCSKYIVLKSGRKVKFAMNENELLKLKKDIIKREREFEEMVLRERCDVNRQNKVNIKMLKVIKSEISKQKKLFKKNKLAVAFVEEQKNKLEKDLRKEIISLRKRRNSESGQACHNISQVWYEQIDVQAKDGAEWLREFKKMRRLS